MGTTSDQTDQSNIQPQFKTQISFDSQHSDMIHDVQFDYYANMLATCSSDCSIRLYDVSQQDQQTLIQVLTGHESPVWQIDFAHPKFGSILASCDYSGKVLIWKISETPATIIKEHLSHTSSVNSIKWAPHELGPILACASSDGKISVLEFKNDSTWECAIFDSHAIGATSLSWSPSYMTGALVMSYGAAEESIKVKRLVSGGCDNLVKIWRVEEPNKWIEETVLEGHSDWVRDVAWAPSIGMPRNTIASCSQDKTVIIWTQDENLEANPNNWSKKVITFEDALWKVEWSLTGDTLAVSCANNTITIWKEKESNEWEKINEFKEGTIE